MQPFPPEVNGVGDGIPQCLSASVVKRSGIAFVRQQPLPVTHKGVHLDCGYRLDLVVEGRVIVELKTVDHLLPIHEAQLLTYLRLTAIHTGLILNFNVPTLRQGIKRLVL